MKKIVAIFSVIACTLGVGLFLAPTHSVPEYSAISSSQSAICTIEAPDVSCVTTLTHVPTVPMAKTFSAGLNHCNGGSVRTHRNVQINCCETKFCIREHSCIRHILFERNIFTQQIDYNIYRLCRLLC